MTKAQAGSPGGTLSPYTRVVTALDVYDLRLEILWYAATFQTPETDGTLLMYASLGAVDNTFYSK